MNESYPSDSSVARVRPRGNTNQALSPDVLGKLQPQALELEEAVLGAMMMEQAAVNSVIDVLKPESFTAMPTVGFTPRLWTSSTPPSRLTS